MIIKSMNFGIYLVHCPFVPCVHGYIIAYVVVLFISVCLNSVPSNCLDSYFSFFCYCIGNNNIYLVPKC